MVFNITHAEQGLYLDKQSFLDALYIRYGLPIKRLPQHCACGATFTVDHSLNCKIGGFVSIRHNELKDLSGDLLAEVCNDVKIEPQLTSLTGERLSHKSSNKNDDARLDVSVLQTKLNF